MNSEQTSEAGHGGDDPATRPAPRVIEVAYHEAGHACVATLLGKSYGAAVYGEHGEGGGMAGAGDLSTPTDCALYTPERLAIKYSSDDFKTILDDNTVTAAGVVAEAMHKNEDERFVYLRGPDRVMVDAGACTVLGDTLNLRTLAAWHGLAMARARSLLGVNWYRVKRVAAALAERRTLTAEEVATLFAETDEERRAREDEAMP